MDAILELMREAMVYVNANEFQMAEECYASALDDAERQFGEGHATSLKALECMARCCSMQGKMDLAIPMYERLVALRDEGESKDEEEVFNGSKFDAGSMASIYQELAQCLEKVGRDGESEAMASRGGKVYEVLKENVEEQKANERDSSSDDDEEEEEEEQQQQQQQQQEEEEEEAKGADNYSNSNEDKRRSREKEKWNL